MVAAGGRDIFYSKHLDRGKQMADYRPRGIHLSLPSAVATGDDGNVIRGISSLCLLLCNEGVSCTVEVWYFSTLQTVSYREIQPIQSVQDGSYIFIILIEKTSLNSTRISTVVRL